MAMSTSAAALSTDKPNTWGFNDFSFSETKAQSEKRNDWHNRQPATTNIETGEGPSLKLELHTIKDMQPKTGLNQKVSGTVLSLVDTIVESELDFGGKKVKIQLPQSLFPDSTKYGMGFFLELIEEDGIRKPKITPRTVDTTKFADIKQKAQKIIDSL
jgi:hypothetical protein